MTANPSRRAVLLTAGAAAALPGVAIPAEASAAPDAALIILCAQHIANRAAYNASDSDLEPEDDPLWHAYAATLEAISAAKPQTLVGLQAKACAALTEGGEARDANGLPWDIRATKLAWDLVNDLLRMVPA